MRHFAFIVVLLLQACGGNSSNSTLSGETRSPEPLPPQQPQPPVIEQYDLRILFMGNSHSAGNGLRNLVAKLIKQQQPHLTVMTAIAPRYGYLVDHLNESSTLSLFNSDSWTHVVLQGQKYSQSKIINYPTEAAEEWISKTQNIGGIPIMFPEWGQLGRDWEGQYVFELHQQIAERAPACVAPMGPAWDKALALRPELELHAADGNHANLAGSFLAALVIAETISLQPVDLVPYIQEIDVNEGVQDFLGQVASQTVAEYPECEWVGD